MSPVNKEPEKQQREFLLLHFLLLLLLSFFSFFAFPWVWQMLLSKSMSYSTQSYYPLAAATLSPVFSGEVQASAAHGDETFHKNHSVVLLCLWQRAQFWHPRGSVMSFPQPCLLTVVSKKSCCIFKDISLLQRKCAKSLLWVLPPVLPEYFSLWLSL